MKMNFGLVLTINAIAFYPTFSLLNPISSSAPKTLNEAIKIIEKLRAEKAKLDIEIQHLYEELVNSNDDIPVTYKPELMNWLRTINQQAKQTPTIAETPSIRFVRFPTYWKLGYQFQGIHPALVVKYNKNLTRALVFPMSHTNYFSDQIIPIELPYDCGRTSYILLDQFQNVCSRNVGPSIGGALTEESWAKIYENYPFLRTSIKP